MKLTKFFAGGYDYSGQIVGWFGSLQLPASGTLNADLCWQLNSVPVTLSYEMDGVDAAGHAIQAKLEVDFRSLDQKSGGALFPRPRRPLQMTVAPQAVETPQGNKPGVASGTV